jgi:electron-transferring-flavoprotein dehydrogenase
VRMEMSDRESMEFDVVIVGAGPAGLSAAIRLSQLSQERQESLSICVIDKGQSVGAHILSGAVLEPRALFELIPDWQNKSPPMHTPVVKDQFFLLSKKNSWRLPTPPQMKNHGNFIISLGEFCAWLAKEAESLGVNIFPGFAAVDAIIENDRVIGVLTDDKGLDKNNQPKSTYQAGLALYAKHVIAAEGCRGSLTRILSNHYALRDGADPQTYGLGLKEIWEIPADQHQAGLVMHSVGWPLDAETYGGSFIYHFGKNLLSIGFVTGLDYTNPYFNPYEEFQRFKTHPIIYSLLKKSKRLAYGARTLVEGGLQSVPNKLTFPGGLLIGDAAGFLNVPKIKGIHNAMKSGMIAAESILTESVNYQQQIQKSWVWEDLFLARNIRPGMGLGLWLGLLHAAIDTYLFRGKAPWTLHHKQADHTTLKLAKNCQKIIYPKHDNEVTFDLMSSVFLTHSQHEENQPCHLRLENSDLPVTLNLDKYDAPEQRYCPAGVYEIIRHDDKPQLQINASNCIHCKACDIKDPGQNIIWTPPEGGSGPNYQAM